MNSPHQAQQWRQSATMRERANAYACAVRKQTRSPNTRPGSRRAWGSSANTRSKQSAGLAPGRGPRARGRRLAPAGGRAGLARDDVDAAEERAVGAGRGLARRAGGGGALGVVVELPVVVEVADGAGEIAAQVGLLGDVPDLQLVDGAGEREVLCAAACVRRRKKTRRRELLRLPLVSW